MISNIPEILRCLWSILKYNLYIELLLYKEPFQYDQLYIINHSLWNTSLATNGNIKEYTRTVHSILNICLFLLGSFTKFCLFIFSWYKEWIKWRIILFNFISIERYGNQWVFPFSSLLLFLLHIVFSWKMKIVINCPYFGK